MNILIVDNKIIPVQFYGGTQRVIWSLGKELLKLGHKVTYLVEKGSYCCFAKVIHRDHKLEISKQIPDSIDVIHFNFFPKSIHKIKKAYIVTMHGNVNNQTQFDLNTVFVSKNHAKRYNSKSFVYNGLDWGDYKKPDFKRKRNSFHFLGKATWGVKNLQGAIEIIHQTKEEQLQVMGCHRLSSRVLKMKGAYFLSKRLKFYGMVGGKKKFDCLNQSKGLIFPVLWHEPFGLAVIESLFFGCPVFGTTYGSLPELVKNNVGFLSNKKEEIVRRIENSNEFDRKICHQYAADKFNSKTMAMNYLEKYEEVLNGNPLNKEKPQLKQIQHKKYLELD